MYGLICFNRMSALHPLSLVLCTNTNTSNFIELILAERHFCLHNTGVALKYGISATECNSTVTLWILIGITFNECACALEHVANCVQKCSLGHPQHKSYRTFSCYVITLTSYNVRYICFTMTLCVITNDNRAYVGLMSKTSTKNQRAKKHAHTHTHVECERKKKQTWKLPITYGASKWREWESEEKKASIEEAHELTHK